MFDSLSRDTLITSTIYVVSRWRLMSYFLFSNPLHATSSPEQKAAPDRC